MRRRFVFVALVSLVLNGCASAGAKTAVPKIDPPKMMSGQRPDFVFPSAPRAGLILDLRIEVMIDVSGRPMMETLKVSGLGEVENRDVVRGWIQASRFTPGQQAGQAVPAQFETRYQVKASVRRMGGG